jgi:hypothetical protein
MASDSFNSWATRDWILERAAVTDFTPSQDEIDARLASESPAHPDSIELRRILSQSSRSSEVSTALLLVLQMLLPTDNSLGEATPRHIGLRALVLLWLLRSERLDFANVTMSQIAGRVGCTRALLSHYARYWNRATGLRCRMQKRAGASDSYRAAARRGWAKRRGEEIESPDALDHAAPSPCCSFRDDDDEDQDFSDSHVPSWARGRGDDDADMDAVAD